MSDYNEGKAIRKLHLGIMVERAAAALPSSGAGDIYTIVGGKVLMTALVGEVTVAIGATQSVKFIANPTAATAADTDLCAAVDINTCDVGDLLGVTGTPGENLLVAHKGSIQGMLTGGVYLQTGTLQVHTTATTAGSAKWNLCYVPIDDGAYVEAA